MKLDNPIFSDIITGIVCNSEQIGEQPVGRFPRPILRPKLEHLYISLEVWMKLRGGNL